MENKRITRGSGDFSPEEVSSLRSYKNNGCPAIHRYVESDFFQWFELYMSGKTYTEISKITNTKKDLILYTSDIGNWHDKRMQYYSDLSDNMLQKCNDSKIETLNTVTTMVTALNQYFGSKFDKFLKTKDESIIETLDTKLLSQYYKATEAVDKIIGGSVGANTGEGKSPLVNINLTGRAKVTQTDENTVEVESEGTITEKEVGEVLKGLSKIKKIRERGEE